MLQAAAQRGVKVNIIVYKEVTQALTRKYLTPTMPRYLHSLLPSHTDPISKAITGLGLAATFASLEYVEEENPLIAPPVTVSSSHTKHALEVRLEPFFYSFGKILVTTLSLRASLGITTVFLYRYLIRRVYKANERTLCNNRICTPTSRSSDIRTTYLMPRRCSLRSFRLYKTFR